MCLVEVCLEIIMPSKYYKYSQAKLCDFNRRRVRHSLEKKNSYLDEISTMTMSGIMNFLSIACKE